MVEYTFDADGYLINRSSKAGHVFVVYEAANRSDDMWLQSSTTLRDAVLYYESVVAQAAKVGGLLQSKGVREVPTEEYDKMRREYHHILSRDNEW